MFSFSLISKKNKKRSDTKQVFLLDDIPIGDALYTTRLRTGTKLPTAVAPEIRIEIRV